MCTVSFIPRPDGFLLAMNRDEQIARIRAFAPEIQTTKEGRAICPSEPGGGTWIALAETGTAFALVNWYSVAARVKGKTVSRGDVVKALTAMENAETESSDLKRIREMESALKRLPLKRINPFRVIGIFARDRRIAEWRWDLRRLKRVDHRWRMLQWISSGYDEPGAQKVRSRVFKILRQRSSAGTAAWLTSVHRSHLPDRGPYSTCMHRADAVTVSCTTVKVRGHVGEMQYWDGPPCCSKKGEVIRLRLRA